MAKIYGKANPVIVWLGEAADNSNIALEEIRVAVDKRSANSSNNATIERPILELLQRPWFRRIWVREQTIHNICRKLLKSIKVLQEVAAARHVLIMCGSTEIDGYAFCLGIKSLEESKELSYKSYPDLQSLIHSVTYLIRG